MLYLNIKKNHFILSLFFVILLINFKAIAKSNLQPLIERALENNLSYLASIKDYEASSLIKSSTKSYLYPTLDLSASIYKNWSTFTAKNSIYNTNSVTHPYNYSIRFNQILFSMETFAQLSKADLVVLQADAKLGSEKNDIISKIVIAYLDVLEAQDSLNTLESKKNYIENQKQSVEKRYNLGLARKLDFDEIEANNLSVMYQEILLKNILDIKILQFKNLTQLDLQPEATLKEKWDSIAPELNSDIKTWQEVALQSNLDIIQLESAIQIANKEISISKYNNYPTLSLSGQYGHIFNNIDAKKDFDKKVVENASIGLNFQMNIYSGGRSSLQTKKNTLALDTLNYKLKSLKDNITTQIAVNYKNINNGIAQLKYQEKSVSVAKENSESTFKSYQLGLKSNSDVLASIDKFYVEQMNLLKTKYSILKSIVDIKKNSGILDAEDIKLIDSYFN